jgi:hypothetical protein
MSKILLLIIMLASFSAVAQESQNNIPLIDSAGNIYYSEVISVDSAAASELYSRAKLLVATIYKSGKDVTQLNDDEQKRIVTKGNFLINEPIFMSTAAMRINHQMILQCKDNKYKVDISTLGYTGSVNGHPYDETTLNIKPEAWPAKKWKEVLDIAHERIKNTISNIKKQMQAPGNNDW